MLLAGGISLVWFAGGIVPDTLLFVGLVFVVASYIFGIVDVLHYDVSMNNKLELILFVFLFYIVYVGDRFKRMGVRHYVWSTIGATVAYFVLSYCVGVAVVVVMELSGSTVFYNRYAGGSTWDSYKSPSISVKDDKPARYEETPVEENEYKEVPVEVASEPFTVYKSGEYKDVWGYTHYVDIIDVLGDWNIEMNVVAYDVSGNVVGTMYDIVGCGKGRGVLEFTDVLLDESVDKSAVQYDITYSVIDPLFPSDLSCVSLVNYNISGDELYATVRCDDANKLGLMSTATVNAVFYKDGNIVYTSEGVADFESSGDETVCSINLYGLPAYDDLELIID